MNWTLQGYLFRELLKTFVLSTIAMVLLFTSGQALIGAFGSTDLGATELLKIFVLAVPLIASYLMPISALFSAAVTYGRFAASNEMDACKAGGINVHTLLLPAGVLAVMVASCTFYFSNYVVPHASSKVARLLQPALPRIMANTLANQGYQVLMGQYAISAGSVEDVPTEDGRPDGHVMILHEAAFVKFDNEGPEQFGTARSMDIGFYERDGSIVVEAALHGFRGFDCKKNQSFEEEFSRPLRMELPISKFVKSKPKWWDLNELLYYWAHPAEAPQAQKRLRKLRIAVEAGTFYRSAYSQLTSGPGELVLIGPDGAYALRIRAARAAIDPDDGTVVLDQPEVVEQEGDRTRRLTGERGIIRVVPGASNDGDSLVQVTVMDVGIVDSQDSERTIAKSTETLRSTEVPEQVREAVAGQSVADILNAEPVGKIGELQAKFREELLGRACKISAVMHQRTVYAISPLILVVLGGALGAIVRGGQVLTAFGVGFIPALFVILCIITGYQLAQDAEQARIGVAVMWSGFAATAVGGPIVIRRFLRR